MYVYEMVNSISISWDCLVSLIDYFLPPRPNFLLDFSTSMVFFMMTFAERDQNVTVKALLTGQRSTQRSVNIAFYNQFYCSLNEGTVTLIPYLEIFWYRISRLCNKNSLELCPDHMLKFLLFLLCTLCFYMHLFWP